jgi:ribosomal protein S3AE
MAKIIKKKFFEIDVPLIESKYEAYATTIEELKEKVIKLDLTRQLKGKSVDLVFQVVLENGKATAMPKSMTLLPFFIKHMMHTGIDYVEDSFKAQTQESEIIIKPFLITRKKVSRAVKRTLRNSAKNWLIDYLKTKTDYEVFQEILSNQIQKPLSLKLKKVYPLAICEIRVFEVKKSLGNKVVKEIGQIEIKKEETTTDDIQEIKEEVSENIEISQEKPKKKRSTKTKKEDSQ